MIGDTLAFAEKYIAAQKAAWENNDFDALETLEHPQVVFQNINGTVFDGRIAHFEAIRTMKEQFGSSVIRQTWQVLMTGGDLFSLGYRWIISTVPQETLIDGILVGKVRDGQLIEEWGANYVVAAETAD